MTYAQRHCQRFVPNYAKMAKETQSEHPDIKFYAVSCTPHKDVCRAMGARRYPEVKFIPAHSTKAVKFDAQAVVDGKTTVMKQILELEETMVMDELNNEGKEEKNEITSISQASSEYLYAGQKNSLHVIEFQKDEVDEGTLPDFLTDSNQGNRVVVFYSHSCG